MPIASTHRRQSAKNWLLLVLLLVLVISVYGISMVRVKQAGDATAALHAPAAATVTP